MPKKGMRNTLQRQILEVLPCLATTVDLHGVIIIMNYIELWKSTVCSPLNQGLCFWQALGQTLPIEHINHFLRPAQGMSLLLEWAEQDVLTHSWPPLDFVKRDAFG